MEEENIINLVFKMRTAMARYWIHHARRPIYNTF
jgi:hypothetical protein